VTSYPTLDELVAVHAQLIARFGGSLGVRDRGALESALARPREWLLQRHHSGSGHHPFVDGNKRVAVTVTAAFLRVNGYRLEFDDMEAFAFLVDLYETGALRFKELEVWLRQHAVPCELPI